jgi:hypothetical protein
MGGACRKDGGNCLIMVGRAGGVSGLDGFVFSLREEGHYFINLPLEGVKITRVSLTGESVFSLDGKLYFVHNPNCDLFSYGLNNGDDYGLGFMSLKIHKPANADFTAVYNNIILLQSEPRPDSWAGRFPAAAENFLP